MKKTHFRFDTSWGEFSGITSDKGLVRLDFPGSPVAPDARPAGGGGTLADDVVGQVREYLEGKRSGFAFPLDLTGTTFQLAVWLQLTRIPYGAVSFYGEVAASIGRPGAARAVGGAAHANPVPLVVPCHRLVGRDGSLTGFGGGLGLKRRLLKLEGVPVDEALGKVLLSECTPPPGRG